MAAAPPTGPATASSTPPVSSNTATQAATDQTTRFNGVVDKLRASSDATAKGLLGLAGAAVTALGITKATDLVPQHWGWETLAAVVVVIGFAAIAGALGMFARDLWKVNRPVFTSSDLRETLIELDDEEKKLVRKVYNGTAQLNGVPSLLAYEARGWRLLRASQVLGPDHRVELQDEADRIRAEVAATLARAGALVVRQRASVAVSGPGTRRSGIIFVAGLILLAGGGGYLINARDDAKIATAQACADAASAITKSGRTIDLPPPCGGQGSPDAATVSADDKAIAENRRLLALRLAEDYRGCLAAQPPQPAAICSARLDDLNRAVGAN